MRNVWTQNYNRHCSTALLCATLCADRQTSVQGYTCRSLRVRAQTHANVARLHLPSIVTDCAACAEGFAPWTAFECRQCLDAGRPSSVGLSVTIVIMVIAGAAALSAYLMRAIHSGDVQDETEITRGSMERRCINLENVFVKVFPLTAVKIVVVVWQIISQVKRNTNDTPAADRSLGTLVSSGCRLMPVKTKRFRTMLYAVENAYVID